MFKLSKITLSNACQYTDLTLTLESGISAIVGPNGTGKSNFLRLIMYGLTGLVDGSWGTQSDLQKDGALIPGYVDIRIADSDQSYNIRRYFIDAVKFPDTVTSETGTIIASRRVKVNAWLEDALGAPLPVIFKLLWGRQEGFEWLLCAASSVISDFMTDLFDLSQFASLRSKIGSALKLLYHYPDRSADIAAASRAVTEYSGYLETHRRQLSEAQEDLDNITADLSALCECNLMSYASWQKSRDECLAVINRLSDVLSTMPGSDKSPDEAQLAGIESTIILLGQRISHAHSRIVKLDAAQRAAADAVSAMDKEFLSLQARYKELLPFKKSVGKCPVCNRPMDEEMTKEALQQAFGMGTVAEVDEDLRSRLEDFKSRYTAMTVRHKRLSDILLRYSERCTRYDADKRKYEADLEACRRGEDAISRLIAELQQATDRLHEVECTAHMSAEDDARKEKLLADKAEAEAAKKTSEATIPAMEAMKHQSEKLLEKLTNEQKVSEVNNMADQLLTAVRDSFGPSRAPAIYLANKMKALNELLAYFGGIVNLPFDIYLSPEARVFRFRKGGYEHPAGHLSGAQQKICAMILQMVLIRLAHIELDTLMLDELDASLDPANRILISEMLSRMRESCATDMLVITREQDTIAQCNAIIDLEALNAH